MGDNGHSLERTKMHERLAKLETNMEWVKIGTIANVGMSGIALVKTFLGL